MKYYWDVEAVVMTPVTVKVIAHNEEEAVRRVKEGAWQSCEPAPKQWDKACVLSVGAVTRTMA